MNKIIILTVAICATVMTASAQELKDSKDSISYSAGLIVAKNFKAQGIKEVNPDIVMKAMMDVINGEETMMKPSEAELYLREYQTKMKGMIAQINKEKGEAFLAENAKKEGVVALDNGLQYEVIKMGEGAKPKATDKVYTHYHGMLIDGTVFDSSVERGEPIEFPLNRVISGWTEILQLMPTGSKWRVYIPSDMAYGPNGAGGVIGPNETLIFDIELLEIR